MISGNLDSQSVAWGLSVDREFGGCKCADEDEMEFGPQEVMAGNTWACQCLNSDIYLAQPEVTMDCKVTATGAIEPPVVTAGVAVEWDATTCAAVFGTLSINDNNGKKCGVIARCQ